MVSPCRGRSDDNSDFIAYSTAPQSLSVASTIALPSVTSLSIIQRCGASILCLSRAQRTIADGSSAIVGLQTPVLSVQRTLNLQRSGKTRPLPLSRCAKGNNVCTTKGWPMLRTRSQSKTRFCAVHNLPRRDKEPLSNVKRISKRLFLQLLLPSN
jgi:hypothetical protein